MFVKVILSFISTCWITKLHLVSKWYEDYKKEGGSNSQGSFVCVVMWIKICFPTLETTCLLEPFGATHDKKMHK